MSSEVEVTQREQFIPWIVWSNEHRAFWAPNRCGYTTRIERAGRYPQADAEAICNNANYRANSTIYEGTPPEICMPAPEALRQSRAAAVEALLGSDDVRRAIKDGLGAHVEDCRDFVKHPGPAADAILAALRALAPQTDGGGA